jgi:hypothetical protein
MRVPRVRFTVRRMMVAIVVVAVAVMAYLVVVSYAARVMLRHEASYNAEMRQLNHDYEVRIRGELDRLLHSQPGGPDGRESADRVFEMLRLSRVANNSREVGSWEHAPHSPVRMAVALKWAKVAADEASYEAALHERRAVDYAQGRMPHHVSDDEVPPFRMPDDWTEDDLKYGRAERDE